MTNMCKPHISRLPDFCFFEPTSNSYLNRPGDDFTMPVFSRLRNPLRTSLLSAVCLLLSVQPLLSAPVLDVRDNTSTNNSCYESSQALLPPHFVVYGDQYVEGTQGPPDLSAIEVRPNFIDICHHRSSCSRSQLAPGLFSRDSTPCKYLNSSYHQSPNR